MESINVGGSGGSGEGGGGGGQGQVNVVSGDGGGVEGALVDEEVNTLPGDVVDNRVDISRVKSCEGIVTSWLRVIKGVMFDVAGGVAVSKVVFDII